MIEKPNPEDGKTENKLTPFRSVAYESHGDKNNVDEAFEESKGKMLESFAAFQKRGPAGTSNPFTD